MTRRGPRIVFKALAAATFMPLLLGAGKATAEPALETCQLRGAGGLSSVTAQCGWLTVPENAAEPDGRTIDLFIAKVPALSGGSEGAALTVLAGGPGGAATDFYAGFHPAFARIHRDHDIVLVDQRGTGRSAPLDCPDEDLLDAGDFDVEFARDRARDCMAGFDADLRQYTTSVAVRDLDAVREAFGYERLHVYGASYGTRVALHYLRRYPDRVGVVILDGVVPPDHALGSDIAFNAQAALDGLFERCAADSACSEAFPDLAGDFARLQARLRDSPETVSLRHPVTGEWEDVNFGEAGMAAAVRLLSYRPEGLAILPVLIHRAASGDAGPLAAQTLIQVSAIADLLSEGMHNSVMCTEDVPFYVPGEEALTGLDETYLGPLQVEALMAICEIWPAGEIDEDFGTPVTADRPVLLISGELDPITPPVYAERAAVDLPTAGTLEVPASGHGVAATGCMPALLAEFVATGDPDALDGTCLERVRGLPFFTDLNGPLP